MKLFLTLLIGLVATALVSSSSTLRKNADQDGGESKRAERRQRRRQLIQQTLASQFQTLKSRQHQPFHHHNTTDNAQRRVAEYQEGSTVIVECSETPLFKCTDGTCRDDIQTEQDRIFQEIKTLYPDSHLVFYTQRLVNAIYVQLPATENGEETQQMDSIRQLDGVVQVTPHGSLEMDVFGAVDYVGGFRAREQFCATGKNVRVAVLDSGIDYTHFYLGGPGTTEAYQEAYGTDPTSPENRQRDGLFPTDVVVDGYDFIGEFNNMPVPDDDPIDSFGHGTAVSEAILTVAPGSKLVGIKVCSRSMACPVFSLIRGLEFALDPNGDGNTDDKVDIINLSLGIPFISPFYNFVTSALETVANDYGVLPVVSGGNSGNVPYVVGGISGSPSSISVGATGHPNTVDAGFMANYSSRGPGGNSKLKPDIVAPSGLTLAAAGTGVLRYRSIQGTSFSAPLVSGAAAVVMERCPTCSPFAIKALLMNNANRETKYLKTSSVLSPVTLSGSGEMQVDKTLQADVWAYSIEDVQPSISLGLVNAASDMTITRTIKVINLSDSVQTLLVSYEMRNPDHPFRGALQVSFNTTQIRLGGACNSEAFVEVTFSIDASLSPSNHMTSAGRTSYDPRSLDFHEFGGHVVLQSVDTSKDISLPFVAIIRQAADVIVDTAETPVIPDFNNDDGPVNVQASLKNNGAGTAQVDAFQLLVVSEDDEESEIGDSVPINDFRFIGYRVLEVGEPECTHLIEFAFNTWEQKNGRLVTQIYAIDIDLDGDQESDIYFFNSVLAQEILVVDAASNDAICTGMIPDHSTSSGNTIIRACSEKLGISDFEGQFGVKFEAVTMTDQGIIVTTDVSLEDEEDFLLVDFPKPALRAPSFDIFPGESLETIEVDGMGSEDTLGLMLVTNSYRRPSSTGASTPETEVLIFLRDGLNQGQRLPVEQTMDGLEFPKATNLDGPQCLWQQLDSDCDGTGEFGNPGEDIDINDTIESPIAEEDSVLGDPIAPLSGFGLTQSDTDEDVTVYFCPRVEVPRASVPTRQPTTEPAPSPLTNPPVVYTTLSPIPIPVSSPETSGPKSSAPITIPVVVNAQEAIPSPEGPDRATLDTIVGDADANDGHTDAADDEESKETIESSDACQGLSTRQQFLAALSVMVWLTSII